MSMKIKWTFVLVPLIVMVYEQTFLHENMDLYICFVEVPQYNSSPACTIDLIWQCMLSALRRYHSDRGYQLSHTILIAAIQL